MSRFIACLLSIIMAKAVAAQPTIVPPKELAGKTIEIIIPYAPGGDTDATQRFIGDQVSKLTGLNIVYLNRPGGNTIIGAAEAAKSRSDGTVLFAHDNSLFVTNAALEVPNFVDPQQFDPAVVFSITPQFFYVNARSNIHSIDDLIAEARNNPKFNYGCSFTHGCLALSWFFSAAGLSNVQQVNFKSVPQVTVALEIGDVHVFPGGAGAGISAVQSGRVRALAVGWKNSLAVFPDAKPLSSRIPNFKAYNIQMVSLPAGAPAHILEFWNRVYRASAQSSETQRRFQDLSVITIDMDVPQTKKFLQQEYQDMRNIREFYRAQ